MSELQSDEKVVGFAKRLLVGLDQRAPKVGDFLEVRLRQTQFIRVRAAVRSDADRLAAPNELGAALTKAPPTPKRQFRGRPSVVPSQPSIGNTAKRFPTVTPPDFNFWASGACGPVSIASSTGNETPSAAR